MQDDDSLAVTSRKTTPEDANPRTVVRAKRSPLPDDWLAVVRGAVAAVGVERVARWCGLTHNTVAHACSGVLGVQAGTRKLLELGLTANGYTPGSRHYQRAGAPGVCNVCGEPIERGDRLIRHRHTKRVSHVRCAPPAKLDPSP